MNSSEEKVKITTKILKSEIKDEIFFKLSLFENLAVGNEISPNFSIFAYKQVSEIKKLINLLDRKMI